MSKEDRDTILKTGEQLLRSWGLAPSSPVSELGAAIGRDPAADAAIAHWLGARTEVEAVALLEQMAGRAKSRLVRREARRALYRLEQRGVVTREEPAEVVVRPFLQVEPATTEAYFLPYVATGQRELFLVRKRPGRLIVLYALTREYDRFLQDLIRSEMTAKEWRAMVAEAARHGQPPLEGDAAHCDRLLWQAFAGLPDEERRPGLDYPAARNEFFESPPSLELVHPIVWLYREDELGEEAALSSEEVLGEPAVLALVAGVRNVVSPFVERVREVETSPLVLTDIQKRERQAQLIAQAVDSAFALTERPSWVHRLRETGYYLHLAGKTSLARKLAAAAVALENVEADPKQIAFCRVVVETVVFVELYQREREEAERARESLVVTPDQLLRRAREKPPRS